MKKILFIPSSNWDNGRKAPDAWWPPSVMGVLQVFHLSNTAYRKSPISVLLSGSPYLSHMCSNELRKEVIADGSILVMPGCWRKSVTVQALWGNRHVTDGCCVRGSLSKPYWMQLPPTMYGVDIGLVESDFAPLVTCHLWGWVRFPALPCWCTTGVPSIVWRGLPGRLLN